MPVNEQVLQDIEDRTKQAAELVSDPDKIDIAPLESEQDTKPKETEEAKQARQDGWVPQDEWSGNPEDWIDAKEFIYRGELMGRIKKQTKFINTLKGEMDDVRTALQELGEHNKKIAENERKKALQELKDAKRDAFQDRDFDTMEEIDERMAELKAVEIVEKPKAPKEEQGVDPAVDAWVAENAWYTTDKFLQSATNGAVQQLLAEDPSLEEDPSALLAEAKKLVQREMPHRFAAGEDDDETPAPRAQVSEPSTRSTNTGSGKKPKALAKHMNAMQRKVAETFVKNGAIASLDEYAKQLDEIGELEY